MPSKKPRPGRTTVRFSADVAARIDRYRESLPVPPARAAVIRAALDMGLPLVLAAAQRRATA